MPEYLSPGVYVEEFDSGIKAMEGVSTSTAGFVGMAEKGKTSGTPVLITSVGDFQRNFGGQLSKAEYGENRYMPYAVEAFFANGGSSCYVMRVEPENSSKAAGELKLKNGNTDYGEIKIEASSVGKWGNEIVVELKEEPARKTVLENITPIDNTQYRITAKDASGYCEGDVVELTVKQVNVNEGPKDVNIVEYMLIKEINGNIMTMDRGAGEDVCDLESAEIQKKIIAESLKPIPGKQREYEFTVESVPNEFKIGAVLKFKLDKKGEYVFGFISEIKEKKDDKFPITVYTYSSLNCPISLTLKKSDVDESGSGGHKLTINADDKGKYKKGDFLKLIVSDDKDKVTYLSITGIDVEGSIITAEPNILDLDVAVENTPVAKNYIQTCVLRVTIACESTVEEYENVSLNPRSPYFIDTVLSKSSLINAKIESPEVTVKNAGGSDKKFRPVYALRNGRLSTQLTNNLRIQLQKGENGKAKDPLTSAMLTGGEDVAGKRIGLNAFKELSDVSIMAVPGCSDPAVQRALIDHCEGLMSRFAVLDTNIGDVEVNKLTPYKDSFDSKYAAIYHPWLQIYSGVERSNTFIPPSGAVAGIYARTDNTRGVWKAPANEVVRGITGLSSNYNNAEQGKLNPKGINLIRSLPGQGIRVWGARTLSSDGNWKYVNVRRLFIYVEESIKANTNWAVFEPNDANLWSRVHGTIKVFLTTLWRNGGLAGSSAEEAFFVNVGKGSTMTEDDILNGRLICVIGVAPVRPAEFIVFRITQKMQDAD